MLATATMCGSSKLPWPILKGILNGILDSLECYADFEFIIFRCIFSPFIVYSVNTVDWSFAFSTFIYLWTAQRTKKIPKRKCRSKLKPSLKLDVKKQGGIDIRNYLVIQRSQGSLEVVSPKKLIEDYRKQEINLHNTISEVQGGLSQIRDNLESNRAGESGGVNLGTST